MNAMLSEVLEQFPIRGKAVSCERYGFGHINETYLVVTEKGVRYILQKINHHIFADVPALMNNIQAVTEYLRARTENQRSVLQL